MKLSRVFAKTRPQKENLARTKLKYQIIGPFTDLNTVRVQGTLLAEPSSSSRVFSWREWRWPLCKQGQSKDTKSPKFISSITSAPQIDKTKQVLFVCIVQVKCDEWSDSKVKNYFANCKNMLLALINAINWFKGRIPICHSRFELFSLNKNSAVVLTARNKKILYTKMMGG